ncbi:FimV/HubP family polar landmark protein [Polynucleobacter sp. AP-Latsch-80-C2]|uniref:FimV/HubP family polar landmark protein n=1 Tax=Polynucleobacter sp. AP-Latsch-80-C2 TaxID=2576931 RepID=UPI001C0B7CDA|nr:FimV/HubP family polar landmark protein [Polynucleobacter sp. AP-Latsch-80-C2]MBU3622411.1 pilus assembly protein FimV [Polynucleobacter sp. AP-Latsch-80-C2]
MSRSSQLSCFKALCIVWLSWSCSAWAVSLGSPQLLSRPGEPLRVEIPIRIGSSEEEALSTLKAVLPNKAAFERLGISPKILELNPQVMVYRNRQEQLMVLLETVNPVPLTDDPFIDALININWASGSLTKTYTLLLGDVQKVVIKPGQTLSEIAALMLPQLDGATLDQAMLALFKANPDAFASGSINRLAAGAELNKPSQALLRSISPAEANQFVADANEQWREGKGATKSSDVSSKTGSSQSAESGQKDRLKIGSSADSGNDEKRFTEELVAQEKALEQAKARVSELEKNIADLQRLLDKSKEKKAVENNFGLGGFGPAILGVGLILLTGILLWALARNARRSELTVLKVPTGHGDAKHEPQLPRVMPERAKALFAGIDLDLSKPSSNPAPVLPKSNPLLDALRVKLNLARAYITIEDYAAAKKSLDEILRVSNSVDPALTIEAQGLLSELNHRKA